MADTNYVAFIIRPDASYDTVSLLDADDALLLKMLQGTVGGYIEALSGVTDGMEWTGFINEEGKIQNLETNPVATLWMLKHQAIDPSDRIVGTCVVLGGVDDEGGTMSLPMEMVDRLKDFCELCQQTKRESDMVMVRKTMIHIGQPQTDLEENEGPTWDTEGLKREFDVLGFAAPFVVVRRKEDGKKGTLEFTHNPRIYFGWVED